MKIYFFGFAVLLFVTASAQKSGTAKDAMYRSDWIDLNKNGAKDPYEDPKIDIDKRVKNLLSLMTVNEKTNQMATLYGFGRVLKDELPTPLWKNEIWKDGIANIDEHLNGLDRTNTTTEYSWPPSKHASAINQVQRFFVEETRLGIPVDFSNEGNRGLCQHGATSFPSQLGVGATWDIDLVSRIGAITGSEAKVLGFSNVYSPILDLARDPRWGRVVECYGEDPFLVSQLGVAQIKGIQSGNVAATVKHFAVYSAPKGGRDGEARTDPHIAPREVEMMYLAPFKAAVVEANVLGVMSSYNDYDGVPITGNSDFLIKKLRKEWGFKGYVVSDSKAVEYIFTKHHVANDAKDAVRQSVEGGLNVRTEFTPSDDFILPLRELVKEGTIPLTMLDERVADVLRVKFRLGLFDQPYVPQPLQADSVVASREHQNVSLEASRKSIVLLKNKGNILPLKKNIRSIFVTGPNADAKKSSVSRYGPNRIDVTSILEGLKKKAGTSIEIKYTKGCELLDSNWPESEILPSPMNAAELTEIEKAKAMARTSDVAVVVLGDDERIVGESKSRTSLDLPGYQLDLVKAIVETGTPTVVILVNGRPVTINWIDKNVPGIIETWFPGKWGGEAVADVLFGDYNPGGKLPVTFPKTVGQIPLNFPYKPGSEIGDPTSVCDVLYPFGFGLSYAEFKYSNLSVTPSDQSIGRDVEVSFDVENTGMMDGDEVVQLYLHDVTSSVTTYVKNLRGFKRISIPKGKKEHVRFTITSSDLSLLDRNNRFVVEPGLFTVMIGSSSADIRLTANLSMH